VDPTDEALVLACRRGDARAWEVLVERYHRLIYSIPRRAGLSDDLCGDVLQQVFIALLTNIERIGQPDRLAAWLVTSARRETWRVSRWQRTLEPWSGDDDDGAAVLPDSAPLPDESFLELEAQQGVRQGVEALDARCRQLLTSLYYRPAPPSYEELAAALDIPVNSIGPTRARCLDKLRRRLQEDQS
jgi:RNA polymerase sigma factor (sigma-70 family)